MRNKIYSMQLEHLPGIKKSPVKAAYIKNVTEARKYLGKYRAITSAGDDGAINIHIDDSGTYRCEYMVYWIAYSSVSVRTKKDAMNWLKNYLKRIKRK